MLTVPPAPGMRPIFTSGREIWAPGAATRLESERSAAIVSAAAREWLTRAPRDQPLFVWVHLYDPHAPYLPPPQHLSRAGGRAYEGEISFADAEARTIIDTFRAAAGSDPLIAIAGVNASIIFLASARASPWQPVLNIGWPQHV